MRGKRVQLSAWVKTKEIENWAGLQFGMFGKGNRIAACDMMGDRDIRGTTDWTHYHLVEDAPADLTSVTITAAIYAVPAKCGSTISKSRKFPILSRPQSAFP